MRTPRTTRSSRHKSGFTLVEVAISVVVLGMMMGIFGLVTATSQSAYESTTVRTGLDVNSRRALTRIASELASIGGTGLAPNPTGNLGATTIRYQRADDVVAGAVVWSPDRQLGFEYAPGEVDDGVDNDGNGLVDDGLVVLTIDVGGANAQRVVLCKNVRELAEGEILNGVDDNNNGINDEAGFNLQRVGDVMVVRLCLERPGAENTLITRTHQTSVRLRNIDQ